MKSCCKAESDTAEKTSVDTLLQLWYLHHIRFTHSIYTAQHNPAYSYPVSLSFSSGIAKWNHKCIVLSVLFFCALEKNWFCYVRFFKLCPDATPCWSTCRGKNVSVTGEQPSSPPLINCCTICVVNITIIKAQAYVEGEVSIHNFSFVCLNKRRGNNVSHTLLFGLFVMSHF